MNKQIITVKGNSMYPAVLPNDKVFISRKNDYDAGAILVYVYRSEQYLIHRLLRCINNRYYCKGDNSFRLEEVEKQDILGQVEFILRNDHIIIPKYVTPEFIQHSFKILIEFLCNGFNRDNIQNSDIYIKYKHLYLGDDINVVR